MRRSVLRMCLLTLLVPPVCMGASCVSSAQLIDFGFSEVARLTGALVAQGLTLFLQSILPQGTP